MRRLALGFGFGMMFCVSYVENRLVKARPLWGKNPISRVTVPIPEVFSVKAPSLSGLVFMG